MKDILTTTILAVSTFLLVENASVYAITPMPLEMALDPNRTVTMYNQNFITDYLNEIHSSDLPKLRQLPNDILYASGGCSVHHNPIRENPLERYTPITEMPLSFSGEPVFKLLHLYGNQWTQSGLNQFFLDGLFNHWIGEYFLGNPLTYNLQYRYNKVYYEALKDILQNNLRPFIDRNDVCQKRIYLTLNKEVIEKLFKIRVYDRKTVHLAVKEGYVYQDSCYEAYSTNRIDPFILEWITRVTNALKANRYFTLLGGNFQREKIIDEKMYDNVQEMLGRSEPVGEYSRTVYAPHSNLTDSIQTMLYYWMADVFDESYLVFKAGRTHSSDFIKKVSTEIPSFIADNPRYRSLLPD